MNSTLRTLSAKRPLILRIRFQLLGAWIVAIALPVLVWSRLEPAILFNSNTITVATLALFAQTFGYLMYRRMSAVPGDAGTNVVLPIFTATYGIAAMAVILLRLDYSRAMLASSYGLTILWFFILTLASRRLAPERYAVVPGGDVGSLEDVASRIEWDRLETPELDPWSVGAIVVDLRADLPEEWQRFIAHWALEGIPIYHVKQVKESITGQVEVEHLSENTFGSINPNSGYLRVKMVVDWIGALAAGAVLLPLLVLVAGAIRLDTPGPALFRQARLGYRGRIFTVYKFRTMHHASSRPGQREDAITFSNDQRITRIGQFLRRTRIDELPQLINILKGEMSWIGPRPEAIELARWYNMKIPFYSYRHTVRPGISGWAQVKQGHVTDVDSVQKKLNYDFYYIKYFSPWLDLVIMLKTVGVMCSGFGAR